MNAGNHAMDLHSGATGQVGPGQGGEGQSRPGTTFTMPVPPSVNQLFRNVRGKGRVKTKVYGDYRAHAVTAIRQQKPGKVSGHVVILLGVERLSLSADIDNRVKAMFDAMQEAGVIEEDNLVTAFAIAWQPRANGLAHIQVMPVQAMTIDFHPSTDGSTGGWFLSEPQPEGEDHGY